MSNYYTNFLPTYTREGIMVYDTEYVTSNTINRPALRLLTNDIFIFNKMMDLSGTIGDMSLLWSTYTTVFTHSGGWEAATSAYMTSGQYLTYSTVDTTNLFSSFSPTIINADIAGVLPAWDRTKEHFLENSFAVFSGNLELATTNGYHRSLPTTKSVFDFVDTRIQSNGGVQEVSPPTSHSIYPTSSGVVIWDGPGVVRDIGITIKHPYEAIDTTWGVATERKVVLEKHLEQVYTPNPYVDTAILANAVGVPITYANLTWSMSTFYFCNCISAVASDKLLIILPDPSGFTLDTGDSYVGKGFKLLCGSTIPKDRAWNNGQLRIGIANDVDFINSYDNANNVKHFRSDAAAYSWNFLSCEIRLLKFASGDYRWGFIHGNQYGWNAKKTLITA